MDALELALRCSSLLMRTMTRDKQDANVTDISNLNTAELRFLSPHTFTSRDDMNESDCERHFPDIGMFSSASQTKIWYMFVMFIYLLKFFAGHTKRVHLSVILKGSKSLS